MAFTTKEVLQQLFDDNSDEEEEYLGDYADEEGSSALLEPAMLNMTLPDAAQESPVEKESLLLRDTELMDQLECLDIHDTEDLDFGDSLRGE